MADDTIIEIQCPACGRKIKRHLSRLRRNPKLQCPTCYRSMVPALELWTRDLEHSSDPGHSSGGEEPEA